MNQGEYDYKMFKMYLITIIVLMICLTIFFTVDSIISNTYNLHISMDNNTLEAIKSVNWTAIETAGRT